MVASCSCGAIPASSTCLLPTPPRSRSFPSSLLVTRSTSALWTSRAPPRLRVSPSVRTLVRISTKSGMMSLTLLYHRPAQPPGHDHLCHPVKGSSSPQAVRSVRSLRCIFPAVSILVILGFCSLLNLTLSSVSDVALVHSYTQVGKSLHYLSVGLRQGPSISTLGRHMVQGQQNERYSNPEEGPRCPAQVLPHHTRLDNRRYGRVPYTDNK